MVDSEKTSPPYLVLVANDQEWEGRSLESILGPQGFAVIRAHTGRQTLDLVRRAQPDAVFIDAGMPDIAGVEVCRRLRGEPRFTASTPVIITTAGPVGRAQRADALRAGAWEYLGQPLDAETLLLKLENFMRAKRETDRYRETSLLDQTTGLYNVQGLARRAREIGADASRHHTPLACVAIAPSADATADRDEGTALRVVEHVSAAFRRTARHSDVIGHLGETEFGVIAPQTERQGALRLVERLRATIDATPITVDGAPTPLRVRAGYCAVPDFAESAVDAVELLMRAATALRHAKPGASEAAVAYEDIERRA